MSVKDAKMNYVTEVATGLFLERSISSVTIKDIARASGFGEATVYRYFSSRSKLIIACAIKLQRETERKFTDFKGLQTGYARLERFYRGYLDIFAEHPEKYRFLSEFDAFCINENITVLEEYENRMDLFKLAFDEGYRLGLTDGTVRGLVDVNTFYYSTTHSVLALCKTLSSTRKGPVLQNKQTDNTREIKTLIDIILLYLKN